MPFFDFKNPKTREDTIKLGILANQKTSLAQLVSRHEAAKIFKKNYRMSNVHFHPFFCGLLSVWTGLKQTSCLEMAENWVWKPRQKQPT